MPAYVQASLGVLAGGMIVGFVLPPPRRPIPASRPLCLVLMTIGVGSVLLGSVLPERWGRRRPRPRPREPVGV